MLEQKKHIREKGKELHKVLKSFTAGQNIGFRPQLPSKRQQLYDVVRKMEDYDEADLATAFPNDTQEALHRAKSILLDEAVRYLVEFAPHNGRRDLSWLLIEAKHLREVGMDTLALIRINDAIRLAVRMEAVTELLEAIKVRRKLIGAMPIDKHKDDHLLELEQWAMDGTAETAQMDKLESTLYRISLLPATAHYDMVQLLETTLDSLPFPTLVRNQMQYRRVRYYIARQRRDIPTCIIQSEAICGLGVAHKHILGDTDVREAYFHAVTFLAVSASEAKDFKAAERYLDQIKALAKTWGGGLEANPSLNASHMFTSMAIKLNSKDWKGAHELAQKVFTDVVRRNVLNSVPRQGPVLRIAARCAFLYRDFTLTRRLALNLKSELSNSNKRAGITHWAAFVSLLILISYAEEGDAHIRISVKEQGSWLRTFGPLGGFETCILAFFREVGESEDYLPTPSSLLALRDDLGILYEEPQYGKYKAMFPFERWIDAKLTGRDLRTFDLD